MRTRRSTKLGFQPPAIGEEELAAVADTLRSGWLTTGPRAALLEERAASYFGAKHVLAVASGTAAMHLALLGLDVGPGDEVITTPITWPATANVIEHCGARPVFCDVRPGDLNIDSALIPELVTPRTKAILPVDLAGQPCDLDPLLALGIPVVEDAAHSFESEYRGRKVGAIADATCFSLYATKNVAAGEGGLVSTNRDDIADRIRAMRLTRRGDGSRYDQRVLDPPGSSPSLRDDVGADPDPYKIRRGAHGGPSWSSTTTALPGAVRFEAIGVFDRWYVNFERYLGVRTRPTRRPQAQPDRPAGQPASSGRTSTS